MGYHAPESPIPTNIVTSQARSSEDPAIVTLGGDINDQRQWVISHDPFASVTSARGKSRVIIPVSF